MSPTRRPAGAPQEATVASERHTQASSAPSSTGKPSGRRSGASASALAAPQEERFVRVTQTRSAIGTKPKHRATLRALGLRRIGASNVLPDRPEIRGMLARVPHLVAVEAALAGAGSGNEEAKS
jgi:large subunit ribosomal protein L30